MSKDLALPDPQTLAAAQTPALIERIVLLREDLRERRDAGGAEELRRRLSAYERYVADKKARSLLEGESRRTEVLIGWLSLDGLQVVGVEQGGPLARFRTLAEHEVLVEDLVAGGTTKRDQILKAIERAMREDLSVSFEPGEPVQVGDFREVLDDIPDGSVDLVFTDPPYDKAAIPLYAELARHGARILRPGASLIAYAGHYALPRVMAEMSEHLRYWWLLACHHDGGQYASMAGFKVKVLWKPLVWFVRDTNDSDEFVFDLISRPMPDKSGHDWSQALAEPLHYIEQLTPPGGLVLDPLCGAGTTLVAAKVLDRRYLGIERDPQVASRARWRLDQGVAA